MEILALVLALVALPLPFLIELVKRPRIEIAARPWSASNPVPWTFATVSIRNKPMPRLLRWLLVRDIAAASTVTLDSTPPNPSSNLPREIDWTKLSPRGRATLQLFGPRIFSGYSLTEVRQSLEHEEK